MRALAQAHRAVHTGPMGPSPGTSPPDPARTQARLESTWRASRVGSTTDHVVVVLPSLNLPPLALRDFADRLPGLEHRYLVEVLALPRVPGATLVFVTCQAPSEEVLEYYLRLCPAGQREQLRRRLHVVEVPDRSARSLSAKLLEHPGLLERLRGLCDGRLAMVEPWNVTDAEVAVGERIGAPVHGTPPGLWPQGFKGAGRRLFSELGVPVVPGAEGIHDAAGLAQAAHTLGRRSSSAKAVVVKHDDSCSGKGNRVLPLRDAQGDRLDLAGLREGVARMPARFVDALRHGGVLEELLDHPEMTSPSVQFELDPLGRVELLSTHEQVIGEDGQLYLGCRLPARPEYAPVLAEHGHVVADELAARGVRGRMSMDFLCVPSGAGWDVRAVEVNLRRGGATHPFTVLSALVPGRYDAETGSYRTDTGEQRCYVASDNLVDPAWTGLAPQAVATALDRAGVAFDSDSGLGVVLHAFPMLAVDGRIGLTAIGRTPGHAEELFQAACEAIGSVAGTREERGRPGG